VSSKSSLAADLFVCNPIKRMRIPLFLSFTATILCVHIEGAVAPSPFLPPGYNSRPTEKPIQSPRNPKPQTPNVQISKEIELGGFFSLGTGESRKLYFSLFNKKVNHAQWITIGEKTDEDFLAESFDFDTETLTVRFGDSSHDLSLRMSKGTPGGKRGSSNARNIASSTPGKPRIMPPRPKTTPTLPPWLANRSASGSSRAGGGYSGSPPSRGGTSGLSSASASQAPRNFPGGRSGGYVPRPINSVNSPVVSSPSKVVPTPLTGTSSSRRSTSHVPPSGNGVGSPVVSPPSTPAVSPIRGISSEIAPSTDESASAFTPQVSSGRSPSTSLSGSSITGFDSSEGTSGTISSGSEIDLNNLPPPPPPPDILPPGPPPNIIPSRED
jgi:hypothetical protein